MNARRGFLRDNALSLVLAALFLCSIVGQYAAGLSVLNRERESRGEAPVSWIGYVREPHFASATFENWESEFLQMAAYVVLTVFLYQRGSAESKDPDKIEAVDAEPAAARTDPAVPWPVRAGGWAMRLYQNSLSLAFLLLFLAAFVTHALSGANLDNLQRQEHGQAPQPFLDYVSGSQFWFESLQNWQSEFFSIGLMVVLSIVLRQRGSPESKPVAMPHRDNPSS